MTSEVTTARPQQPTLPRSPTPSTAQKLPMTTLKAAFQSLFVVLLHLRPRHSGLELSQGPPYDHGGGGGTAFFFFCIFSACLVNSFHFPSSFAVCRLPFPSFSSLQLRTLLFLSPVNKCSLRALARAGVVVENSYGACLRRHSRTHPV